MAGCARQRRGITEHENNSPENAGPVPAVPKGHAEQSE
jgi:hypothetical protein